MATPSCRTGHTPANSRVDKGAFGDFGVLFAKDSSKADRLRAMRDFGAAVRVRLSTAAAAARQDRDSLAERSAQVLAEVAARVPIRTADALRRQFGDDPEVQSQHVIGEASHLGGLLWTAAAVPGPPPVVQAI